MRLEVLSVEKKSGTKDNRNWSMTVCQCVVHNGSSKVVGELVLPKDHPEVAPGFHTVESKLGRDRNGKLQFYVEKVTPEVRAKI